jgi:23S rRNA pseudouridine1911/1915/1917 synthase
MSAQIELRVPREASGDRLDAWLAEASAAGSRRVVQEAIETGRVLVDGRVRPKGFRLAGGERVRADLAPRERARAEIAAEPRIAWEDESLVIVDKPAGVVVHPAAGHFAKTLVEWLDERAGGRYEPLAVHRLDKETSGLMLIAKTETAQASLQRLIRERRVRREYMALLRGRIASRSGTIDAPIGRHPRRRTLMSTQTLKPRAAVTHFTVERFLGDFTLARARLETGRTHQIRAHFAAVGHPVAGDAEYGGRGLLGLRRQFLHSTVIAFPHPGDGSLIEARSELPPDLAEALERAGSSAK